jgi:glycine cleavage system aminomethyltransferase T
MSALEFMSPGLAAARGSFLPVARSPMARRQLDLGARFEERDGWRIPVSVPGEKERLASVGIADLSHLGKLEVRTARTDDGRGQTPVGADPGTVTYAISPRRTLVLCPTAATTQLHERLAVEHGLVLDVTALLGVLVLAGPEAATVLRRLTHLHQFPSSGEVAHVNGVHVLEREGAYWLVFPQEFGDYLWDVAVDRAEPLRGGPVGVDALGAAP